jgi:diguanylate cyclase (GGDEF)-like protein/PAS domain S-box-containing protein
MSTKRLSSVISAEPDLREDAQRAMLESIFASLSDSLLVMDTELRVVEANDHLLRQMGRTREELTGEDWANLFPHLQGTGREEELRAILASGEPYRSRIPVVNASGEAHLFDVSTYPVHDAQTGQVTHLVEFAREITEEVRMQLQIMDAHADLLQAKEQLEEKTIQINAANTLLEEKCNTLEAVNRRLERLAVIDVMTDLPNHRAFQEQLTYQIKHADRTHRIFSLLLFDVDNFKLYNDRYGHPEGDDLLAVIARLTRKSIRAVDLPARYGGEEFAVILPETDRYGAAVVAERLREEVASYGFRHTGVTVSIGVAEYPSDAADGGDLVFCADKAMYHAKANGKNSVSLWRGSTEGVNVSGEKTHAAMQSLIRRCQSVPSLPSHLPSGSASGSRILLVDQDELSLGTLREALQGHGYAVACASCAQEALEMIAAAAGSFDLLLTDVALTDKDGLELRTEARVLCPGLPVIFTSAYANPVLLRQVLDDEDCEFLAKPFRDDHLASLVEKILLRRIRPAAVPAGLAALPEAVCA